MIWPSSRESALRESVQGGEIAMPAGHQGNRIPKLGGFAFGIARCLDTNIDESLLGVLFVVG